MRRVLLAVGQMFWLLLVVLGLGLVIGQPSPAPSLAPDAGSEVRR